MVAKDAVFSGSIPALYERYLGGLLFRPYAEDLARRLADLASGSVLETAAGTGIVTEALARALPAAVSITASDLNQPMLDHAAAKPGMARVIWRQADALALPFPEGSFDAVVCQFGAMFFPDRPAAFRQARRVLKPGGRFILNVWDDLAHNPVPDVVHQAIARRYPKDPPQFLVRTPHGYHDAERIRADLRAAGFASVVVETVALPSRAASSRDPAIGFCQGTPLRAEIEARDPSGIAAATDAAAAAALARFGDGALDATMQAHVVTAAG